MASQVLYVANDNLITLSGLKDASAGGDFINDATVQVTLLDSDGEEVTPQSWPTTLSYVTDSDGDYEAVLEEDLNVSHGDQLTARVTADAGGDSKAQWDVVAFARTRTD